MNQHIQTNTLSALKGSIRERLMAFYDERESSQLVKILFFDILGINATDLISKAEHRLSESEILKLHFATKRLLKGEPVQYVTGKSYFAGLELIVGPDVLIPRPETEELVRKICSDIESNECSVLDIGTGSGCIALGIKSLRPTWKVSACDVSEMALNIAKRNVEKTKLHINLFKLNVLDSSVLPEKYDVIVSNPPYIPWREKGSLSSRVIDFEPHLALFVEDQHPLIFFERILHLAQKYLHDDGVVFFEIHESFAAELTALKDKYPIATIEVYKDMQGKDRMVKIKLSK